MRLILFITQIAMLAAGFSSNRADAMAGASVFAVLCVVLVFAKDTRPQPRSGAIHRPAGKQ